MTTVLTPWGYALTLGTITAQILPPNGSRKGVIFFNPSGNTVAVCPAFTPAGVALAAVVNGAGSITIIPGGTLVLPQPGWPESVGVGSAFNGIASGAATPFSIWEF